MDYVQNIKKWHIPMPNKDYMVVVQCSSYNHERYIEDALKGFVMQKTNFPFCVLMTDDASTDNTAEIISRYAKKYPDIIIPILLRENHMQKGLSREPYIGPWHNRAKYIAVCEGDDYWTDPFKLQRQVDFLENHPDYSMCFHNVISHWDNGEKEDSLFAQIEDREYSGIEIFEKWIVPTASVMFKIAVEESYIYKKARGNKKFCYGDIISYLCCAYNGRVYGMSDVMSVYRRHEGSAVFGYDVNRQIRQAYHSLEIYRVFGKEYESLSIEKFFDNGMEAFLNAKAEGDIHYELLWDLVRYAPKKTFSAFGAMLKRKVQG